MACSMCVNDTYIHKAISFAVKTRKIIKFIVKVSSKKTNIISDVSLYSSAKKGGKHNLLR